MGGAVYYSIHKADGQEKKARKFVSAETVLKLLGADNIVLQYATNSSHIIAIGSIFQIVGTGMIPFIRNYGSSLWAMMGGFVTNIILDYLFVWSYNWGMKSAAFATIIGQGVTMMITILYAVHKRKFFLHTSIKRTASICGSIVKVGLPHLDLL